MQKPKRCDCARSRHRLLQRLPWLLLLPHQVSTIRALVWHARRLSMFHYREYLQQKLVSTLAVLLGEPVSYR